MNRSADYTIQGFLYQFNKTILEILSNSEDTQVTVEGIIEDIDIEDESGIKAIQCKYHEGQQDFALSLIYKPILQMMHHFYKNEQLGIKYIIYAYFPNETYIGSPHPIDREQMSAVLQTKNKDLAKYTILIKDDVNIDKFLDNFSLEFGHSFDALVSSVHESLKDNGVHNDEIETLAYPNAIQIIANLSIKHDEESRKITKAEFLRTLREIRKTAISRWTLSLKSHKKIIQARKKQLKANLDKNARLRYFIIHQSSIDDFSSGIVLFVNEYLDKYHFKLAHIKTPLLCLDCSQADFNDIRLRLHQKGIFVADGFVGDYFDKNWFFREPIARKISRKEMEREFRVRMLRYASHETAFLINEHKCDDLFIIGECKYDDLNIQDVNVECLSTRNLLEIKYLLGVSNVYE